MTDDSILSKEAFLLYQNAYGFEPYQGNLTIWKGIVNDRLGHGVEMTVTIPDNFPFVPPEITIPCAHPIADPNGRIITRSMQRWKSNMHVYQVVREARQGIASANFVNAEVVSSHKRDDALNRQIEMLKQQLRDKENELELLLTTPSGSTSTVSTQEVVEESLINLEADLYALEESYDRLEIDSVEFAKKFLQLRKRYFMIEKSF